MLEDDDLADGGQPQNINDRDLVEDENVDFFESVFAAPDDKTLPPLFGIMLPDNDANNIKRIPVYLLQLLNGLPWNKEISVDFENRITAISHFWKLFLQGVNTNTDSNTDQYSKRDIILLCMVMPSLWQFFKKKNLGAEHPYKTLLETFDGSFNFKETKKNVKRNLSTYVRKILTLKSPLECLEEKEETLLLGLEKYFHKKQNSTKQNSDEEALNVLKNTIEGKRDNDIQWEWIATSHGSLSRNDLVKFWAQKCLMKDDKFNIELWNRQVIDAEIKGKTKYTSRDAIMETNEEWAARITNFIMQASAAIREVESSWLNYENDPLFKHIVEPMQDLTRLIEVQLNLESEPQPNISKMALFAHNILKDKKCAAKVLEFIDEDARKALEKVPQFLDKHDEYAEAQEEIKSLILPTTDAPKWVSVSLIYTTETSASYDLFDNSQSSRRNMESINNHAFRKKTHTLSTKELENLLDEEEKGNRKELNLSDLKTPSRIVRHSWSNGRRNMPEQRWQEQAIRVDTDVVHESTLEIKIYNDVYNEGKIDLAEERFPYIMRQDLIMFTSPSLIYTHNSKVVTLHEHVIESYVDSLNYVSWALDYLAKKPGGGLWGSDDPTIYVTETIEKDPDESDSEELDLETIEKLRKEKGPSLGKKTHVPQIARSIVTFTKGKLDQLHMDCDNVINILRKVYVPHLMMEGKHELIKKLYEAQINLYRILLDWKTTLEKKFVKHTETQESEDETEHYFEYYTAFVRSESDPEGCFTYEELKLLQGAEWNDAAKVLLDCIGQTYLKVEGHMKKLQELSAILKKMTKERMVTDNLLKVDQQLVFSWAGDRTKLQKYVTGACFSTAHMTKAMLFFYAKYARANIIDNMWKDLNSDDEEQKDPDSDGEVEHVGEDLPGKRNGIDRLSKLWIFQTIQNLFKETLRHRQIRDRKTWTKQEWSLRSTYHSIDSRIQNAKMIADIFSTIINNWDEDLHQTFSSFSNITDQEYSSVAGNCTRKFKGLFLTEFKDRKLLTRKDWKENITLQKAIIDTIEKYAKIDLPSPAVGKITQEHLIFLARMLKNLLFLAEWFEAECFTKLEEVVSRALYIGELVWLHYSSSSSTNPAQHVTKTDMDEFVTTLKELVPNKKKMDIGGVEANQTLEQHLFKRVKLARDINKWVSDFYKDVTGPLLRLAANLVVIVNAVKLITKFPITKEAESTEYPSELPSWEDVRQLVSAPDVHKGSTIYTIYDVCQKYIELPRECQVSAEDSLLSVKFLKKKYIPEVGEQNIIEEEEEEQGIFDFDDQVVLKNIWDMLRYAAGNKDKLNKSYILKQYMGGLKNKAKDEPPPHNDGSNDDKLEDGSNDNNSEDGSDDDDSEDGSDDDDSEDGSDDDDSEDGSDDDDSDLKLAIKHKTGKKEAEEQRKERRNFEALYLDQDADVDDLEKQLDDVPDDDESEEDGEEDDDDESEEDDEEDDGDESGEDESGQDDDEDDEDEDDEDGTGSRG